MTGEKLPLIYLYFKCKHICLFPYAVTARIYWAAERSNVEMSTGKFPIARCSDVQFTIAELNLSSRASLSLTCKSTQNTTVKDINQRGVINRCSHLRVVQFTLHSLSHKGKAVPRYAGKRGASENMATRMSAHIPVSFNCCFNLAGSFIALLAWRCPLTVKLFD